MEERTRSHHTEPPRREEKQQVGKHKALDLCWSWAVGVVDSDSSSRDMSVTDNDIVIERINE